MRWVISPILLILLSFSFPLGSNAEEQEEEPNWYSSCSDSTNIVVAVPNLLVINDKEVWLQDFASTERGKTILPLMVVSLDGKQAVLFPGDKFEVRVGRRWYTPNEMSWSKILQISKVQPDSIVAIQAMVRFDIVISLDRIKAMRLTMKGVVYDLTEESTLK